jgi:hypothetical protein
MQADIINRSTYYTLKETRIHRFINKGRKLTHVKSDIDRDVNAGHDVYMCIGDFYVRLTPDILHTITKDTIKQYSYIVVFEKENQPDSQNSDMSDKLCHLHNTGNYHGCLSQCIDCRDEQLRLEMCNVTTPAGTELGVVSNENQIISYDTLLMRYNTHNIVKKKNVPSDLGVTWLTDVFDYYNEKDRDIYVSFSPIGDNATLYDYKIWTKEEIAQIWHEIRAIIYASNSNDKPKNIPAGLVKVDDKHAKDSLAIYDMKLHQVLSIGDSTVKRVPGGWLYSIPASDQSDQVVFVPFDNEFQQMHNEGCVLCGHKA